MKSFACGAVVPDCVAVFQAETEDEILTQVAAHAERDHGMSTVPSEVVAQVRDAIRTV